MGEYKIFFKQSVEKDLRSIPKKDLKRILLRIEALAKEPRQQGCEKLSGQEKYRVRQGPYRIIYSIQDQEFTVWVVKVGHRKDIYR
ncbi:MAG TPA: type II toxin-antitoxin system RelE/ParE family toxin [Smithellaceae bacterium]|jgi:mRNA interferase RelE/StbE|nr:type II toxin-antitoxin system RelE/ParE family toxin [Smithellaceae bacterium]HQF85262.1 type II toxin-antitoxin system RelE/ParE family toxin [Smithellaceae bacterium]HQG79740.1 type II toxin-antitoxin system RelE/ParE family toxin [Smithellaceae bacterium]